MPGSPPSRRRRPQPAAPTLVLLVRHGLTPTTGTVLPGRARGLHLAERGREQAHAVATRLATWAPPGSSPAGRRAAPPTQVTTAGDDGTGAGSPAPARRRARPERPRVAAVYSSPLERTRETAAPIAAALGLTTVAERGLLECDFGAWTGAALKDLAKLPEWTTVQRWPSGFCFPDGESFTGMQARMVGAIGAICARHRGQAVVAVSHADPIKAAVAGAMGTHLDLFQRIVISPCSVTAIRYGPGGPTVLTVNSAGSLADVVAS
ncbi:MAG: histidine phosphatase family protein [Acidimicrobiales bacterium]